MANYQFCQYPEENSIFTSDAFKDAIGKPFKLHLGDVNEEARLVDAVVSKDGKSALVTVSIQDSAILHILQKAIPNSGISIVEETSIEEDRSGEELLEIIKRSNHGD